ncbi:SCP2 sterol-binding domain-containing protein [Roseobacter litoralis]|uniref:SCP2 sterol-binding domain-containing protein n=1 Tax=Roseobacter litoralis TaxID=42443 RepID=UPI002492F3E6|nr:SCP2 sterol-binding domain-containing protein [Roseobacter litoralis]
MSDIVNGAVERLNEKLAGSEFTGTAKFDITGEGAIIVDGSGARPGDEDTDVTLTADADTFQSILAGETDPTGAFMTGKLTVDGDMAMAMQLAAALG